MRMVADILARPRKGHLIGALDANLATSDEDSEANGDNALGGDNFTYGLGTHCDILPASYIISSFTMQNNKAPSTRLSLG